MSGKQHLTLGITISIFINILLLISGEVNNIYSLVAFSIGNIIGSVIPDIDSKSSIVSKLFNKLVLAIIFFLILNVAFDTQKKDMIIQINLPLILFALITIFSKLSSHRSFTHKWFGTLLYCYSVYLFNNLYLFLGFTLGYLLHIICDKFSKNGKYLDFFEFRLPFKTKKKRRR